jgi:hypothetical protein
VTTATLQQVGIHDSGTKGSDRGRIVSNGDMSTPALAIIGDVKTTGRVPSVDEVADLITSTS